MCRSERGFAMIALLVTLAVMTVLMTMALPVLTTMAQREREAELVFRGQQYARAIGLFQRKYGNAIPPNVDVLLNEKFLRKKYKDPITNDDFNILGPGSPELAEALNSAPPAGQQSQQGSQGEGRQGAQGQLGRGGLPPNQSGFGLNANNQGGNAPGGVMAVASKSTKTSLRLYNGRDKYNQWVFMATQASLAAGRGGRGGRAGGTGGEAGRGRGPQPQDGRGRGTQTSPFGGSPFGGNRSGQPQPFGGAGMPPTGQPRGGRF